MFERLRGLWTEKREVLSNSSKILDGSDVYTANNDYDNKIQELQQEIEQIDGYPLVCVIAALTISNAIEKFEICHGYCCGLGHAWNVDRHGTIIDTTAVQFIKRLPREVSMRKGTNVIEPTDPRYGLYKKIQGKIPSDDYFSKMIRL